MAPGVSSVQSEPDWMDGGSGCAGEAGAGVAGAAGVFAGMEACVSGAAAAAGRVSFVLPMGVL